MPRDQLEYRLINEATERHRLEQRLASVGSASPASAVGRDMELESARRSVTELEHKLAQAMSDLDEATSSTKGKGKGK